jgi:hypothetical protein
VNEEFFVMHLLSVFILVYPWFIFLFWVIRFGDTCHLAGAESKKSVIFAISWHRDQSALAKKG